MARPRLRVRRHATLLGVLVILFGLLELNQWLPGGWPGGGGEGGFRTADTPRDDPSRVRPSEGTPLERSQARIRLTVRTSGGRRAEDWHVRGSTGDGVKPDDKGSARVDASFLAHGFAIEGLDGRRLEHGPARLDDGSAWVVHLPATPTSVPPELPHEVRLRVLRAEDDAPIPDARIQWAGWAEQGDVAADDDGWAVLPTAVARLRVSILAPDRFRLDRWVDPREAGGVTLRLARRSTPAVTFVDETSQVPVELNRARVLSLDGDVLFDEEDLFEPLGRRDRIDLDRIRGGGSLRDALLEVGGKTHPIVRIPLADLPSQVGLSQGRAVRIRATDRQGSLVGRVRLEAHYVPPTLGAGAAPTEAREVQVVQTGHALLPEGVEARVLVEAGASAPRAVEVPVDPTFKRSTVKLGVGGRLKVEVVEKTNGQPVPRAEVVVVSLVDGVRLERRELTGQDGAVRWNELPIGWIEVYARAAGKAWAATTKEVVVEGESALVLALEDGGSVRVLVETPTGVPLEGVRVRSEAEHREDADVVPPDARPALTNRDGAIVLADLRDRTYRLHLSKPGYRKTVLHGVRPGAAIHFATLVPETR